MKHVTIIVGFIMVLFCSGCAECDCAPLAIQLLLVDQEGQPVYADSVDYTFEGEMQTIPDDDLASNGFYIGTKDGTYQIWVDVNGVVWESEEIEVSLSGPDSCRLPKTKQVTLTFHEDDDPDWGYSTVGSCQ